MDAYSDKAFRKTSSGGKKENKSAANNQSGNGSTLQLKDNRPVTVAQRKLQKMADCSPQTEHTALLQAKTSDASPNNQQTIQKKDNKTGLPDNLKSGVENLSGYSMDDVKVHRNSDKPAQLNAHAYAQGTDIHLAPGQEKHLPHEAWHVVQQKQGRVKPTKQLKGKININDDEGLEKEADVMGDKAAVYQTKTVEPSSNHQPSVQTKNISSSKANNTAQLNKNDAGVADGFVEVEEEPSLQGYDEFDELSPVYEKKDTEKKEAGTNLITKKVLDEIQGDKGENRKIDLEGELSLTARFKGIFGKESTYSKFLSKAKEFNDKTDVLEKQKLLKDLKPLAREWLKRHEEESQETKDDNEVKKLITINRFLRQTTTNYTRVIESIQETQNALQVFRSDPIGNRTKFHDACVLYKKAKNTLDFYKTNYPPSVNLMYSSETKHILSEEALLIKMGSLSANSDIDTKLGFKASGLTAGYNLDNETLNFEGKLEFAHNQIFESKGNVHIICHSDGNFENVIVKDASCKANFDNIRIDFQQITYDYDKRIFSITLVNGDFDLLGRNVKLNVFGASLINGNPNFEKIHGQITGEIDSGLGIKAINPQITLIKDDSITTEGTLSLSIPGFSNASGEVSIQLDAQHNINNIEIKDGKCSAAVAGFNLDIDGIGYNYELGEFSADSAVGSTEIFGTKVTVAAQKPSFNNQGEFNYDLITGKAQGTIDTGLGFKVSNPQFYGSNDGTKVLVGALEIELPSITNASGEIAITLNGLNEVKNAEIENGSINVQYADFNFKMNDIGYNYSGNIFHASTATGNGEILSTPIELKGEKISYSKDNGFAYAKITGKAAGIIDSRVGIKVLNPSVTLLKDGKITTVGDLSLSIPGFSNASGGVSIQLDAQHNINNIEIKDGKCSAAVAGFNLDIDGIEYNYESGEFSADSAVGSTEIFGTKVTVAAQKPSFNNQGEFNYDLITGKAQGTIDTGLGFKVSNPQFYGSNDGTKVLVGALEIELPSITNASGEIAIALNGLNEVKNAEIENGSITASIAGLNAKLDKLSYTHNNQTLKAVESTANLDVLGHKVGMVIEEPSICKGVLDFKSITGELPELDFDFIKLKKTGLTYNKEKKKIQANTTYDISNADSLGLSDLTSKGNVQLTWSKTEGVALIMKEGDLTFKIFNQGAHATKIEIDSNKRLLKAGEFKLDLDFGDQFKRSFTGKDVEFNKNGLDFSKLSMAAGGEEIDLKALKLKPSEYSILKVGSGGYALRADGSVELTLPEVLGVNGKGNLAGDISFNFKNNKSDYHLKEGGAEVEVPNPLYKLGSLLGSEGGASADFELAGGIPVFPGVSATFGVFLRFAASFGENITATVNYDPKKDAILFHIGTSISAKVDAGAFIGVKGGYDVLISLEVRLEAGGEIKVTGNFGYGTEFPLNKQPEALAKLDKSQGGITYDMEGAVKLKAALALIASALYFFRKDFRIELGDGYELGSFTLDKENGFQLNPTEKELASEEDLKKEADPEYKDEVAKMNIEDLLNKDYTYRFTKDEKSTTKKAFEAEEENRKKAFNAIEGHRGMFYSVPIEDMKRFNHFINNRFNWDGIMKNFMDTQELPAEKLVENTKENESNGNSRYKFYVLETLGSLGNDINIAQAFVTHYAELLKKIQDKKALYTSHGMFHTYLTYLDSKHNLIKEFEEFKRKYLHSRRKTDKGIQLESTETGKGLFDLFESNYQALKQDYKKLSNTFLKDFYVINEISEQEKTLIAELRTDFENKKAKPLKV